MHIHARCKEQQSDATQSTVLPRPYFRIASSSIFFERMDGAEPARAAMRFPVQRWSIDWKSNSLTHSRTHTRDRAEQSRAEQSRSEQRRAELEIILHSLHKNY